VKFRRQHPVGKYVVYFFCEEKGLAIELDGGQHALPDATRRDEERSAELARDGVKILRFWNSELLQNLEGVLSAIYAALRKGEPPSP